MKTTTLLIKKTALTDAEIEQLRTFCQQRAFDLAYYPGMPPSEANQYHILEKPYFYQGTTALLANQEQFTADYKYHLAPARDDQPYFFHFFKWAVLPELLSLRHQGGLGLIEWGYPVLIVTLIQALLISMLFIIAPLWVSKSRISGLPKTRVLIYFFSLGLAFLFIEMAFIQKFILFLGHPLYAAATVLSAFLIFAGLGSRYATQFQRQTARFWGNPTGYATLGISILALGYLVLLPGLLAHFIALPLLFKMGLSLLLIAPLAFWMGMPFPLGLTQLGQEATAMIPWAWAINGCASVLSAIVATLLAVHFGFSWVILLAVMLYGLATLCYPQFDN
ncbi:MAG: hypothetical protein SVR94_00940 [Pseudomonadota bacterium]|nr:hypothetical protein [Pseudomonadota bacterium]